MRGILSALITVGFMAGVSAIADDHEHTAGAEATADHGKTTATTMGDKAPAEKPAPKKAKKTH